MRSALQCYSGERKRVTGRGWEEVWMAPSRETEGLSDHGKKRQRYVEILTERALFCWYRFKALSFF